MNRERVITGAATFGAGYFKRWIEQHYDTLMASKIARPVMDAGPVTRYGIEAILYALTAYVDANWTPQSLMGKLIKEVAKDAPSEISRRMVNGFREQVVASRSAGQAQQVEEALFRMDDDALGLLFVWLVRIGPEERSKIQAMFDGLSDEEIEDVLSRSHEELVELISQFEPPPQQPVTDAEFEQSSNPPSRFGKLMRQTLDAAHQNVDKKLAAQQKARDERKASRKGART